MELVQGSHTELFGKVIADREIKNCFYLFRSGVAAKSPRLSKIHRFQWFRLVSLVRRQFDVPGDDPTKGGVVIPGEVQNGWASGDLVDPTMTDVQGVRSRQQRAEGEGDAVRESGKLKHIQTISGGSHDGDDEIQKVLWCGRQLRADEEGRIQTSQEGLRWNFQAEVVQ